MLIEPFEYQRCLAGYFAHFVTKAQPKLVDSISQPSKTVALKKSHSASEFVTAPPPNPSTLHRHGLLKVAKPQKNSRQQNTLKHGYMLFICSQFRLKLLSLKSNSHKPVLKNKYCFAQLTKENTKVQIRSQLTDITLLNILLLPVLQS